jgi:transcriptional regulator with XRE-family HTH domain
MNLPNHPHFFERFTAARKQARLGSVQVARKLGLHHTTLSRWRRHRPQGETIAKLSKLLGVPVAYLVGTGEKEPAIMSQPSLRGRHDRRPAWQRAVPELFPGKDRRPAWQRNLPELF